MAGLDAPAPSPDVPEELTRSLLWFHVLAIVIDVMPFWIVCYISSETVNRYMSARSFVIGATLNLILVCHIIFTLHPNEHLAALFVATAGLFLGAACAFICLLQRPAAAPAALAAPASHRPWARHWMSALMVSLVMGSFAVLKGIDQSFRAEKDKGWDIVIRVLAIIATAVLNGIPQLQSLLVYLGYREHDPDIRYTVFGAVMSFLNLIDALFFVVYADLLGEVRELLWLVSTITAVFSGMQFVLYLGRMQ